MMNVSDASLRELDVEFQQFPLDTDVSPRILASQPADKFYRILDTLT